MWPGLNIILRSAGIKGTAQEQIQIRRATEERVGGVDIVFGMNPERFAGSSASDRDEAVNMRKKAPRERRAASQERSEASEEGEGKV